MPTSSADQPKRRRGGRPGVGRSTSRQPFPTDGAAPSGSGAAASGATPGRVVGRWAKGRRTVGRGMGRLAAGPGAVGRRWRLVRARQAGGGSGRPRRPGVAGALLRRIPPRWRLAGLITLVVATAVAWLVFGTETFGVRDVRVTGSLIASADQVRAAAGVSPGTPLARVDTGTVGGRVATLPSVASVDVYRSWPSTLVIAVTERTPAAAIRQGDRYLVVDASGVVFNRVTSRPGRTPLLVVAQPGPGDPATHAALQVLATLTPPLRQKLVDIRADTAVNIRLTLTGGITVVWGDSGLSVRKAEVATSLLARATVRIDVSAPDVVAVM